jgi:hypothetical protein
MRLLLSIKTPVLPLFNVLILATELGQEESTKVLANQLFTHLHDLLGQDLFLEYYN